VLEVPPQLSLVPLELTNPSTELLLSLIAKRHPQVSTPRQLLRSNSTPTNAQLLTSVLRELVTFSQSQTPHALRRHSVLSSKQEAQLIVEPVLLVSTVLKELVLLRNALRVSIAPLVWLSDPLALREHSEPLKVSVRYLIARLATVDVTVRQKVSLKQKDSAIKSSTALMALTPLLLDLLSSEMLEVNALKEVSVPRDLNSLDLVSLVDIWLLTPQESLSRPS
jgi:hypothetical protein